MKGFDSDSRSWADLPSRQGAPTRLSPSSPAVPVELWHCDGDLVGELHGYTPAVTTGTLKWQPQYSGFVCAFFDGATVASMAAYEASLRLLGDKTITAIVAMHSLASAAANAGVIASFSGSAASDTEANNTVWAFGAYDAGAYWLSEHGSGVDDVIAIGGRPAQSEMAVYTARLESDVLTTWVNGRLVGGPSSASTTPTGGTTGVFTLGSVTGSTAHRAVMTLGGLAVYDSAISDAAILAQAQAVLATRRHA